MEDAQARSADYAALRTKLDHMRSRDPSLAGSVPRVEETVRPMHSTDPPSFPNCAADAIVINQTRHSGALSDQRNVAHQHEEGADRASPQKVMRPPVPGSSMSVLTKAMLQVHHTTLQHSHKACMEPSVTGAGMQPAAMLQRSSAPSITNTQQKSHNKAGPKGQRSSQRGPSAPQPHSALDDADASSAHALEEAVRSSNCFGSTHKATHKPRLQVCNSLQAYGLCHTIVG